MCRSRKGVVHAKVVAENFGFELRGPRKEGGGGGGDAMEEEAALPAPAAGGPEITAQHARAMRHLGDDGAVEPSDAHVRQELLAFVASKLVDMNICAASPFKAVKRPSKPLGSAPLLADLKRHGDPLLLGGGAGPLAPLAGPRAEAVVSTLTHLKSLVRGQPMRCAPVLHGGGEKYPRRQQVCFDDGTRLRLVDEYRAAAAAAGGAAYAPASPPLRASLVGDPHRATVTVPGKAAKAKKRDVKRLLNRLLGLPIPPQVSLGCAGRSAGQGGGCPSRHR